MATDTRSMSIGLLLSLAIVLSASYAARWYYDQKVAHIEQAEQVAMQD